MGFVWNNFGVLKEGNEDDFYYYIYNEGGDWRKISLKKYKTSIPTIKNKVALLIGKPILFRTSQNTSTWSAGEWFSDIDIDKKGLENPDNIIPFSAPTLYDGDEPDPESVATLKEKLKKSEEEKKGLIKKNNEGFEREKKLSERNEDLKSSDNDMKDKLSNTELELSKMKAQLQENEEKLPAKERKDIKETTEKLKEMNIVGTTQSLQVRGHPVRELALRLGHALPDGQRTIKVTIKKHLDMNTYAVELEQFDEKNAITSLGYKNNQLFIYNFNNSDTEWFDKFKKIMGGEEAAFKDRTDLTYEDLAEIHKKVIAGN